MQPNLPQLEGGLFLTDAGLETDLIFNHGLMIPEFASHTLLAHSAGRTALASYFQSFLKLAASQQAGFILDTPTWRAQPYFGPALKQTEGELRVVNLEAVRWVRDLKERYATPTQQVVLNGVIGPRGDAYAPESILTVGEAEAYHAAQVRWLADAGVDMISAITFTQTSEAIGLVRAARDVSMPVVVSFTVETDGRLPTGQSFADAIDEVDAATGWHAAYYMINCAHPDHLRNVLTGGAGLRRLRGLRCNASRCSHAELDEAVELDAGDPLELGQLYAEIVRRRPWINVLGGCCGTDLRHVRAIAGAVRQSARTPAAVSA